MLRLGGISVIGSPVVFSFPFHPIYISMLVDDPAQPSYADIFFEAFFCRNFLALRSCRSFYVLLSEYIFVYIYFKRSDFGLHGASS